MTLQQASAAVALVSAAVAVVIAVLGVLERRRASAAQQAELKRQGEQWRDDFAAKRDEFQSQAERWREEIKAERRSQEALLRKDFLLELYRHRLASYSGVLRTLGAVSDVEWDANPNRYEALHENKELLRSTAAALNGHLYGEPGLLMTMPTRNYLHSARYQCLAFLEGGGDLRAGDRLVTAFFHARRYLRADLELIDDRTPENLDKLVHGLGDEPGPKGVADNV
jgi:hypothetical protein